MLNFDPLIHELLDQPLGTGDAMRRLIDAHERARPNGDWRPYRDLPYDDEARRLARSWLPAVFADDPPGRYGLKGLFFGLYEPLVWRWFRRRPVADVYVAGSSQFEPDTGWDWAFRPAYFPRRRYARSRVLAKTYRLAHDRPGGLGNDAEASLCLGFAAFATKVMLGEADGRELAPADPVGVAVGLGRGRAALHRLDHADGVPRPPGLRSDRRPGAITGVVRGNAPAVPGAIEAVTAHAPGRCPCRPAGARAVAVPSV